MPKELVLSAGSKSNPISISSDSEHDDALAVKARLPPPPHKYQTSIPMFSGSVQNDPVLISSDSEVDYISIDEGPAALTIPSHLPFVSKTLDPNVLASRVLHLQADDIARFVEGKWYNDVVMDFGLSQCLRRHQLSNRPHKSVWVFSTFFYSKLSSGGYQAVATWSRNWDVFAQEMIVIPVHHAYHWTIMVVTKPSASLLPLDIDPVHAERTQVISMDSLGGEQSNAREMIQEWLRCVAQPRLKGKQWHAPQTSPLIVHIGLLSQPISKYSC
ncbi:hypothetical protein M422DRAFT_783885 [Sphaerobolus stellatus SS14]|uniref:Ubiquitin-like protease family profile domain-containing protein n=1 Tax=Sphaerobolus stellatus (strain SS14) TaxID=990650 RepID=A0A0C9U8L2_SPHS4|nr:hypothetical protein M422DRAFT_783885 [Sphaerobolus stellatus SS14]